LAEQATLNRILGIFDGLRSFVGCWRKFVFTV